MDFRNSSFIVRGMTKLNFISNQNNEEVDSEITATFTTLSLGGAQARSDYTEQLTVDYGITFATFSSGLHDISQQFQGVPTYVIAQVPVLNSSLPQQATCGRREIRAPTVGSLGTKKHISQW